MHIEKHFKKAEKHFRHIEKHSSMCQSVLLINPGINSSAQSASGLALRARHWQARPVSQSQRCTNFKGPSLSARGHKIP